MGPAIQHITLLQDQLRKLLHLPVGEEMIHDIRVTIKKLRALWIIHPIGSAIPFKTSFPSLRKLFKVAAQTRDLQMTFTCLQTLPDFAKFPTLSRKLSRQIKLEQKKLEGWVSRKEFRKKVFEDLHRFKAYYKVASGFLLKKNKKQYRHEVAHHLAEINPRAAEKLHQLRKLLKNYMYQSNAFHADNDTHKHLPSTKSLESFQKDLGNWHDWWNTGQWLETIESSAIKPRIQELLKQVKTKEAALKREMIRNIKSSLKTETA